MQLSRHGRFFRSVLAALVMVVSLHAVSATAVDPRLATFLESQIKDKKQLQRTLAGFAANDVDLESFIHAVFTGAIRMDSSPDNAVMLAHLADYLAASRPQLDMIMLLNMQNFLAVEGNRTEARTAFLRQIEALVFGVPAPR